MSCILTGGLAVRKWIKTMSQLHDVDQHTHDRWHCRLPRQLNPNPPLSCPCCSDSSGGWGGGVNNAAQGTMCCVLLKLVPWVKRTRSPSDGDTLIRDSQVFYHSVRLKQISFWGGMRYVHVIEYLCVCAALSQICACIRYQCRFWVLNKKFQL